MNGDKADITRRLRAALPGGWFPVTGATDTVSATPVLDGLLTGLSEAWAWLYDMIRFVVLQSRIRTATGVWLDVIALDYFGLTLRRAVSETDIAFRRRILLNLLRDRATRAAVIGVLTDLTGRAPVVFEPSNTGDSGAWGDGSLTWRGMAYGTAGGWGSLDLPFQAFITAYRPSTGGVASVAGYYAGTGWAGGGYGVGAIEYVSPDLVNAQVTDANIFDAVAQTIPAGTIGWTRISS